MRVATRHLKKAFEKHQVAAKHARRKPSMENEEKLDEASQELAKETLETRRRFYGGLKGRVYRHER